MIELAAMAVASVEVVVVEARVVIVAADAKGETVAGHAADKLAAAAATAAAIAAVVVVHAAVVKYRWKNLL